MRSCFDGDAACHIAFGEAYPECITNGGAMSRDELAAAAPTSAIRTWIS